MADVEKIRGEVQMGLKLLAFKSVSLEDAPMSVVDEALKAEGWEAISAPADNGAEHSRYYYSSMQKSYAHLTGNDQTGSCEIKSADETEMLQSMSFEELKHLGNLIDKKSVAFITIYSQKELASAKSEEELKALNERNAKMIEEAEVALRKR